MASARSREAPDSLQDLQVKVVRISELGARQASAPQENLLDLIPLEEPVSAPLVPVAPSRAAFPTRTRIPTNPALDPLPSGPTPPPPAAVSRSAAPAAVPRTEPQSKPARRLLTPGRVFFLLVVALLFLGWHFPTERYLTPKRGLGYALGIIGGGLMLLLLLYSLRKRYTWLRFLGPTPSWFRFHMVLGILGPLCILYHSNFTTGATNSNVALFAMLIVAGSGLIGRYIYAHIHHGLYGRKLQLSELRTGAENLRALSGRISFLPELVARIEAAEQRLLKSGPSAPVLGFARPLFVAIIAMVVRWRLHFYVWRSLHAGARRSAVLAAQRQRLYSVACAYVDRRVAASRRVAGFEGYERLFSLWHALHIPLIFMMIIAALIHVVAVHVY